MPTEVIRPESDSLDGITFDLNEVEIASDRLPTVRTREAIQTFLGCVVESCSDYFDDCVEHVSTNTLISAARLAHNEHRPFVLSPDLIWLTLLRGLSDHLYVSDSAAYFNSLGMDLAEAQCVFYDQDDFPVGSLESPWGDVVADVTVSATERFDTEFNELFQQRFSTTNSVREAVQQIQYLSTVKHFVKFVKRPWICGIPSVTLEGTPDDWQRIRDLIERFEDFGLGWWLDHLRPICEQFAQAACGIVDLKHWLRLYAATPHYCGAQEFVTGWIGKLFPYETNCGLPGIRNRLIDCEDSSSEPKITDFPLHFSELRLRSRAGTTVRLMGGSLAISQDAESGALSPKIAWCVSRQSSLDTMLDRIAKSERCEWEPAGEVSGMFSDKMGRFYSRFDSVTVRDESHNLVCRFRSTRQITESRMQDCDDQTRRGFVPIADLHDGRLIVVKKIWYPDDHPDWDIKMGIFVCESEYATAMDLVSGDFEHVLTWVMELSTTPDRNSDRMEAIARIDFSQPDHADVSRILNVEWKSPCFPQDEIDTLA